MKYLPAIVLFFSSIIFGIQETAYFGWHLTAESPGEWICDGIALTIGGMGWLAIAIADGRMK